MINRVITGILLCLAALLVAAPVLAHEALVGNYIELKTNTVVAVVVKNEKEARLDRGAALDYMLTDDDTVWVLYAGGAGWHLSDYGERLKTYAEANDPRLPHNDVDFTDTGRVQEIGGYTGKVFEIYDRRAGVTYEAVLCDDPDVFMVSRAIMLTYSNLHAEPGARSPVDKIIGDTGINYGVLKLGGLLEFTGLEFKNYPDDYWELPQNIIF